MQDSNQVSSIPDWVKGHLLVIHAMRLLGAISVLVVLNLPIACVMTEIPPGIHNFDKTFHFDEPKAELWPAVIEAFADRGWLIRTLEQDSGIIATELLSLNRADWQGCDCGTPIWIDTVQSREISFNIFVRDTDEGGCDVTINTRFQEKRLRAGSTYSPPTSLVVPCNSTGILEKEIAATIELRL